MFENWSDLDIYHAHTHDKKESETLLQHSELVLSYYEEFEQRNKEIKKDRAIMWKEVFEEELQEKEIEWLERQVKKTVAYHDIGKINPNFQREVMKNKNFKNNLEGVPSYHSMYGSVIFLVESLLEVKEFNENNEELFSERKSKERVEKILLKLAYIISKHHGSLTGFSYSKNNEEYQESRDIQKFIEGLVKAKKEIEKTGFLPIGYSKKEDFTSFDLWKKIKKYNKPEKQKEINNKKWFLHQKIIFSYLVTADFYATYQYMSNEDERVKPKTFGKEKKEKMKKNFQETYIYKNSLKYKDSNFEEIKEMNEMRSHIFWELEKNYKENKDKNIFFVEAPTGSGKTISSFNLALNMLEEDEMNKLMYIFPQNTLIDQTEEVVKEFTKDVVDVTIVNSVKSEIKDKGEGGVYEDEKLLFESQMLRYEFVMTSHVKFFEMLFGVSRSSQLQLENMQNAVLIIDEIQSYKIDTWRTFMNFLQQYAKIFNWKVIIMSATLPPLDFFLEDKDSYYYLLKNSSKYFQHELFKGRVEIIYDKFKSEGNVYQDICDIVKLEEEESVLIEILSKRKAFELYEYMKENTEWLILKMDGSNKSKYRRAIINFVNKYAGERKIVLIGTQVIEAGVDIDFSVGIKDSSIIEAEEQFIGRINRSNKGNGKMYLVNITDEGMVYKNDIRLNTTYKKIHKEYENILERKKYKEYYETYVFVEEKEKFKNKIEEVIENNDFEELKNMMKQINQETLMVLLETKESVETINKYKNLISKNEISYAEKQRKLELLKPKLDRHCISLNLNSKRTKEKAIELEIIGTEKIGMYYIVENATRFFDYIEEINEEFFNVEKYLENEGDFL